MKYIVKKRRKSIEGASITVMNTGEDYFEVSLIPHTHKKIKIRTKTTGDYVNWETDMWAKDAEKILLSRDEIDYTTSVKKEKSKMSFGLLPPVVFLSVFSKKE